MRKLNFGCGDRISKGWINIDFHSTNSEVLKANLLAGFPFQDNYFDAVYSSHVLEHFTREQGLFLIKEAYRVLKPNGILRIVVPDLEETCREYVSILDMHDTHPEKSEKYEWILIELLDQLVRSSPGGEMSNYFNKIITGRNDEKINYVRSRTENVSWAVTEEKSISEKLRMVTIQKLATKMQYWYIKCVGKLIPKHLRSLIFNEANIGERHRWMYDSYGLQGVLNQVEFRNAAKVSFNFSSIPQFNEDHLDSNPDGTPYKNISVYCEAVK